MAVMLLLDFLKKAGFGKAVFLNFTKSFSTFAFVFFIGRAIPPVSCKEKKSRKHA